MATNEPATATSTVAEPTAPRLEVRGVRKVFGTDTVALDGVDLLPEDGEFMTILGPSGCGKTTLLRLIAGFEGPTDGEVLMNGHMVSNSNAILVQPEGRELGMVFQTYAVWPHMTVTQNVAYPLKLQRRPKTEIRRRVGEVLELVSLTGFEDRMPSELSGGQQQRVALARALASEPNLLLLDEPLSNLDAKLREQMRRDLRVIQQEIGITTILVTHDQDEAIQLSDRIVVMSNGEVQQVGPPEALYRAPANEFVADFLGAANVLAGEAHGDRWRLPEGADIELPEAPPSGARTAVVRPEDLDLIVGGRGATVEVRLFSGANVTYALRCGDRELIASTRTDPGAARGDEVGLSAQRVHYLT